MSEEDKPVVDQVLETGEAALELVQVAGSKVVQSVKDGSAQELLERKISDIKGAAEETTRAIRSGDITLKSLSEQFSKSASFDDLAAFLGGGVTGFAVEQVYKTATNGDGIGAVFNHFVKGEKGKPDGKPQDQSGFDFMAILSGDFSSLISMKDKAVSSIDGLKDLLSGNIGEKLAGWWPDFDIPSITGMLDSFKQSALALFDSFFGSGNTIESNEQDMLADTANDSQTPPSRKSGTGLAGVQRPQGAFKVVSNDALAENKPTGPAPEGPEMG